MVRRSARAPLHHPWVGRFECPDCGEPFAFVREQDGLTGTEDAFLQVAHVHTGEDAIWTGSVFRRKKGGRYPEDVKVLRLVVQEQNRSVKERKG
jgi:hypothetical protein